MRAILFASATVTSLTGRRSSADLVHAPSELFQLTARKTIEVAPKTSILRISELPTLVIRPRRFFPPVECYRGTKPSQAANCRALPNKLMSLTVAAMSDAVIGPTPGMVASRRATSLLLGVSIDWGDRDGSDMTGRVVAGWGIVDEVGSAVGGNGDRGPGTECSGAGDRPNGSGANSRLR